MSKRMGGGMRIYVFAPYRNPRADIVVLNVLRAIETGEALAKAGYWDVFIPHLFHYWDQKYEHPHEFWMRKCIKEVERSNVLVGSGVMSEGCKEEVDRAKALKIPVFLTVKEFLDDMKYVKEIVKTHLGIGAF